MASNWQMRDVSKNCSACGRAFGDGEAYRSVLEIEHDDLLCASAKRSDFCTHCWQAREGDEKEDQGGLDSYFWEGVFRSKEKKRDGAAVRKGVFGTMLAYISEHVGTEERRVANLIFALAVILERKKILVPCQSDSQNPSMLVYTHAKSGETFLLRQPEKIEEDKDFINTSIQELSSLEDGLLPEKEEGRAVYSEQEQEQEPEEQGREE